MGYIPTENSDMRGMESAVQTNHHNQNAWQMDQYAKTTNFYFGSIAALAAGLIMCAIMLAIKYRHNLCKHNDTSVENPKDDTPVANRNIESHAKDDCNNSKDYDNNNYADKGR